MIDDTIRIDMSFTASTGKIWNAWTDPQLILQWFGSDPNGKGISETSNFLSPGNGKMNLVWNH